MEEIIYFNLDLDCSVHQAFKMFTTNDLLENWLALKADINLEKGGKYELFWDLENKHENSTLGCKITGFEEDLYLSFDWKGPKQFESIMNNVDPLTHVIVTFLSDITAKEKSKILLFHTGWQSGVLWKQAREFFKIAWRNSLHELQTKIKRKEI
jgi:uncharacterized protein YndB with AHSA1/START domain